MKICVYCASSAKIDKSYFQATERLAKDFVAKNITVVYGGGATGLMGQLADTIIEEGGKIKGIMPTFMRAVEWNHPKVVDMEYTETMSERKAKFLIGIDGVVALPGGSGTLEELFEVITLKRLGKFTQPIVILNTGGYYDPLREILEKSVSEKFMHPEHLKMWKFVKEPEEVIPAIMNSEKWGEDAINFAANK